MTESERTELLELYRSSPSLVETCLGGVPDDALDYKPGPERWSIRQIALHIVDADINSFMRFRKPVAEPGSTIPVYDQDAWAAKLHGDDISIETALELYRAFRAYNAEFLAAVTETEWKQTVHHPERGSITLEDVLRIYANHSSNHVEHINRTLDAWRRSQAGETIDPDVPLWGKP